MSGQKANTIQVLTNAYHFRLLLKDDFILFIRSGRSKEWIKEVSLHDKVFPKVIKASLIINTPNILSIFNKLSSSFIKALLYKIASNLESIIYSVKSLYKLRKFRFKIEVIYSRSYHILFFLMMFLQNNKKIKYAIELHDTPHSWIGLKIFKYVLYNCENIFVVTKMLGNQINILTGLSSIWLPDGVGEDVIKLGDKSFIIGKKKTSLIFGYMGRFSTYGNSKGVEDIILAFNDEKLKRYHKLKLIGGSESEYKYYCNLRKKLGLCKDVEIYKFIPRPMALSLAAECDVLIMAQPNTEFYKKNISPLKLFEYMALGKLIINSRLPSIEEILKKNTFSLSFNPGNVDELSELMVEVANNYSSYEQMRIDARIEVKKNYTWEKRALKILKTLEHPVET